MFFLFLILLFVFLANKDSVRQARLNRDLACLRRRKMEAVLAARRAQVRIDQIEAARAIPAAEAVVYGGFVPLKDYAAGIGSKADTVRRQCVRGAVPGAVRIGGYWYVPADAPYVVVPAATVISSGSPVQVVVGDHTGCAATPSAHDVNSLTLPVVYPTAKKDDYPACEMAKTPGCQSLSTEIKGLP